MRMRQWPLFSLEWLITATSVVLALPIFLEPRLPILLLSLLNVAIFLDQYQPYKLGDDGSSKEKVKEEDFKDSQAMVVSIILIVAVAWHDFSWISWRRDSTGELASPLWYEWFGIILILIGVVIRQWSRITLAQFFTYQIGIRKDHQLIVTGPYASMIHPGYTGMVLCMIGTSVFMVPSGYLFFGLTTIVSVALLAKRVQMEEKMLAEEFGAKFTQRLKTTARFLPGVF